MDEGNSKHRIAAGELEELRRRETALRQFVALAAHELRAPAAVVHGVAATIAARPEELRGEHAAALTGMLLENSERLVRLLDQLLDLSLLDADAVKIERHMLSIRPRLEQLVSSVAGDRADEVELDVDADLEAHLDPDALDRIVGNLVTNAFRYGAAPVRISAAQVDRHFRLTVEDCGDGVKPDLAGRMFERFAREPGPGSGLGLAIAQSYARALGGSILYEPGNPGARFCVVVPAPRPGP